MRSPINRFLLILMMLALPVQTFASAAMLGCAFSHQGQTTHQALDKRMLPDAAAASCHAPGQTAPSPAHDCMHCAACYLASVLLMPAVDAAPVFPVTYSAIPHADDAFIGFIPDSPERPPRAFFA